MGREKRAGQRGGGDGGEWVSGGGNGFSLHAIGDSDEKELGVGVQDFELICNGDGGVNVATCATGGENYSDVVGGSGGGGGGGGVRDSS